MLSSLLNIFRKGHGARNVIVHNHLFKNAGSTIDWILHKNFGNRFVDHRDNTAMIRGKTAYLETFFRENPHVRAFSSHHLALPLPVMDGVSFHLLMMFRHPLERVTSVYNFERAQPQADTLGARFASKHSLRDYVIWRMRPDVPPSIRNYHLTRALPNSFRLKPLSPSDMDSAKKFLESIPLLGIVERFDESMVLFEEKLRPIFPAISFAYKPQNVRQNRSETQEQRLDRLRAEIGEEAFDLFVEHNRLDLKLYEYAQVLCKQRLDKIEYLGQKLIAFRGRL